MVIEYCGECGTTHCMHCMTRNTEVESTVVQVNTRSENFTPRERTERSLTPGLLERPRFLQEN